MESATKSETSLVRRLMNLFAGFEGAYGTHGATNQRLGGVKQEIKSSARTIRSPVTEELWAAHVDGSRPIGIIPIREDNQCKWGCIDVDRYDLNHADLVREVESRKLPLTVLKSKSGGAHLMLFLDAPRPAIDVRSVLGAIAASMGMGQCEVFPKQTQIFAESGDAGNWLNMPYLGGDETERYAVKPSGAAMTLSEFVRTAEERSLSDEAFAVLASVPPADRARPDRASRSPRRNKKAADSDPNAPPFSDGPPCLEHLAEAGFGEGSRNNGLFAIGIYCQKRYGEKWIEKLQEFNQQYMSPPLPPEEVLMVQRSLQKTEYHYPCKQAPIVSVCNQSLCRTRRHGITNSGDYPVISSLSVLGSDPPVWFLDVEEQRLEVTTEALMNYREFQRIAIEQLHKCFQPLKQDKWLAMVSQSLESLTVIQAPAEVSLAGQFSELLSDFLTNRQRGKRIEDVFAGRPYEDEEEKCHYFRLRDLSAFLEREGLRGLTRGKVTARIRQIGGEAAFKNIKGKGANLFKVPSEIVDAPITVDPPEIDKEPM